MVKGNAAITAADARGLRNTSAHIPVDFDELEDGLVAFTGPLGALPGAAHPLVQSHQKALKVCHRIRPPI